MSGIDIISYKLGQKSAGGGSGGGSVRLQNKTFNANGTYTADAEYDGLGTVRVDVEAKLQDKTATANGSYTADSGFDGLGTVVVSVPEKEAVLEDKTITENGTYTAAAGYDGFGTVTVDVAGSGGSDEDWIIGDGNTHIWITLTEGRTSPALAMYLYPNSSATIDWGDGTPAEALLSTGTSSAHQYSAPGDYIITVIIDGTGGYLRNTGSTQGGMILVPEQAYTINPYGHVIKKVELGANMWANGRVFLHMPNLSEVYLSDFGTAPTSLTTSYVIQNCNSLKKIIFGGTPTQIPDNLFASCPVIETLVYPETVTTIGRGAFSAFSRLTAVTLSDNITTIGEIAFWNCSALKSIVLPKGLTSMSSTFYGCKSLENIHIPSGVASIGSQTFYQCAALSYIDFSTHVSVPTLEATDAFQYMTMFEIRVPAALVDEWKAATNWSTYADYIVGV